MLKKFKDVFQSLECSNHINELLNFVFVEKVSASSDMSLIKVNIIAERIIEKKTILELEMLIKDKMFPKKNIKIKIFEKFNQHKNKQEIYKILDFISEIYNETSQTSKYNTLNSNIKIGIENFKFNDDVNPLLKAFKEAENEYKEDAWFTILGMHFDFIVDVENSFNQDNLNLDIESEKYLDKFYKNKKLVNYVKILRENSIIKVNVHHIINLNILELDWKKINSTIKEITDRLKNNKIDIEKFKRKLKKENKDKYEEWKDILNELV